MLLRKKLRCLIDVLRYRFGGAWILWQVYSCARAVGRERYDCGCQRDAFAAIIAALVCSELAAPNILGPVQWTSQTRRHTPKPRQSDRSKNFTRRVPWRGAPRANDGASKEASPRRGWRRGEAPRRTPSTPSPRQQQRGTGNLKTAKATSRPRPARASATPSPRGRPCRRPST